MRLLFLAYYHRRYMQPLARYAQCFRAQGALVNEMYPDAYYKHEVLDAFRAGGYDVVAYFGHGTPNGWAAYGSIGAAEVCGMPRAALSLVLSFSCYSLLPPCGHPGLGWVLLERGIARFVAGYPGPISYSDNLFLCEATLQHLLGWGLPRDPVAALQRGPLIVAHGSALAP